MSDGSKRGYNLYSNTDACEVTCWHGKHELTCKCWVDDIKTCNDLKKDLHIKQGEVTNLCVQVDKLAAELIKANEALDACVLVEPDQIVTTKTQVGDVSKTVTTYPTDEKSIVIEHLFDREFKLQKELELLRMRCAEQGRQLQEMETTWQPKLL